MGLVNVPLARSGEVVQDLLRDLAEAPDPRDLVQRILAQTIELMSADRGAIFRRDGERLTPLFRQSLSDTWVRAITTAPTRPLNKRLDEGEILFVTEPADEQFVKAWRDEGIAAVLLVPLRRGGVTRGTLSLFFDRPVRLLPAVLRVARTLGDLTATALGSALDERATVPGDGELLEVLFAELPVALGLIDARNLRVLRLNDRAQEPPFSLYRLLPGRSINDTQGARLDESLFRRAAAGEFVSHEFVQLRRRGRTWHFHLMLRPLRGAHGEVDRILMVGVDVTMPEQRRRRLQAVLDMLP